MPTLDTYYNEKLSIGLLLPLDSRDRTCSKCETTKDMLEFTHEGRSKSGRSSVCKGCRGSQVRGWIKENNARFKQTGDKWRLENKDEILCKFKVYSNNRRKTDIQFRLRGVLTSRLGSAIRGLSRGGSAVRDLGCTISFLIEHLSKQFTAGMTWENWGIGKGKWNIDHIMPLKAFDLTNRQHVLLCCHYGNLQPLWSEDNIRKGGRQPLQAIGTV